jgi:peptidoglycan/xylan/chitin deacetylase (PgdA/CDA1 family)
MDNSAKDLWPDGARLALSLVVALEEGTELSPLHGDRAPDPVDEFGVVVTKPIRNLPNESNYQYGLKAGAPRVLDLLSRHGVRATFAATGMAIERLPSLAQRIIGDGHEICAHGWRWVHQYRMSETEERAFIGQAVAAIERTTGQRPTGWISRYLFTANTRRLLVEAGFRYHMDDYSDDVPFWDCTAGTPIVILPYAIDSNDMKMWTAPSFTPQDWLDYAVETFDVLYKEGVDRPRMMSLGVHLRIIGRPGRVGYLEKFIQHARRHPRVWIATRQDIAACWSRKNPAPSATASSEPCEEVNVPRRPSPPSRIEN